MLRKSLCFVLLVLAVNYCSCSLMPGGEKEMTKEEIEKDDRLQEAVRFAVNEYSSNMNTKLTATDIISAKVQVVNGLKFTAFVVMHPSDCVHDPKQKIAPCPEEKNQAIRCAFEISYQPWVPAKISVLATRCLRK